MIVSLGSIFFSINVVLIFGLARRSNIAIACEPLAATALTYAIFCLLRVKIFLLKTLNLRSKLRQETIIRRRVKGRRFSSSQEPGGVVNICGTVSAYSGYGIVDRFSFSLDTNTSV
jgi:hypothetical protein